MPQPRATAAAVLRSRGYRRLSPPFIHHSHGRGRTTFRRRHRGDPDIEFVKLQVGFASTNDIDGGTKKESSPPPAPERVFLMAIALFLSTNSTIQNYSPPASNGGLPTPTMGIKIEKGPKNSVKSPLSGSKHSRESAWNEAHSKCDAVNP